MWPVMDARYNFTPREFLSLVTLFITASTFLLPSTEKATRLDALSLWIKLNL